MQRLSASLRSRRGPSATDRGAGLRRKARPGAQPLALVVRSESRPRLYLADPRRLLTALLIVAVVIGCGASLGGTESSASAGSGELEAQLAEGCLDSVDCRHLAERARADLERCTVSCKRERQNYKQARHHLRDALEREALAEHEQRTRALEREQELGQAHEAWQTRERQQQARDAQRADAEREHQRQLELIRTRQQGELKKLEQQSAKRVAYFRVLSARQRVARLRSCHRLGRSQPDRSQPDRSQPDRSQPDRSRPDRSRPDRSQPDPCQQLAEELVAAAADPREAQSLVQLHETSVSGGIATSASNDVPAVSVSKQRLRQAKAPIQCCDGTLSVTCSCGATSSDCCAGNGGSCGCAGS